MSFDDATLEALGAYLDDELDDRERAEIETQLAQSDALRAELRAIEEVRNAVRALPIREAPTSFLDSVLGAGAGEETPAAESVPSVDELAGRRRAGKQSRSWRAMSALAGAAAASIVILAALFPSESTVRTPLASMVRAHAAGASGASGGADPVSVLAPVAQPVKFGR